MPGPEPAVDPDGAAGAEAGVHVTGPGTGVGTARDVVAAGGGAWRAVPDWRTPAPAAAGCVDTDTATRQFVVETGRSGDR
ncbi:hypothetical protein [Geodermatophilus normandii]|uniref:hypothetical protein n=1 Tax=Geodermatophilus normandii TaxID=1137989 RepID=UPI0011B80A70|nr:hypothetical protein [Geodermatophilus normandii]